MSHWATLGAASCRETILTGALASCIYHGFARTWLNGIAIVGLSGA